MVGLSGVSVGPAIRPPLTGGVTSNNYIPPNNASPPYASGTGLQSLTWTNPSFHNNLVNSALSGNQSALGAMGGAIVALGGGLNDIGALLNATNKNILSGGVPTAAPRPSVPTAGVVDTRTVTPQPVSYNQPYTDNSQSIAISLPDMFSAQPMLPPSQMDFGQMAPLQPMNIPRPVTPQPSQSIPAAVSMGVGNLPMAPTPTAAVSRGGSPVNLQPQQARSDQQLPEVSPVPQGMPTRPQEPRFVPPPSPPQQPYVPRPTPFGGPYANPYAPQPAPPPPMFPPQRYGDIADLGLQPPRQFYQGPPQPKAGFLARLGRGMQAAAGGLNPSIGAAQAAKARAQAEIQMKMIDLDAQGDRNYADNKRALAQTIMQERGQDSRTDRTQANENYRHQLTQAAQGKLSQSQALDTLGQALAIAPQNQADYARKYQMLDSVSRALGQDFTGMVDQVDSAGSQAIIKQSIQMKRDAIAMLREQNDLQMQPIENDIKRLNHARLREDYDFAPEERNARRTQMKRDQLAIKDLEDPDMRQARKDEILARRDDWARRKGQDEQQGLQRSGQMAASQVSTANQVLMNPFASPEQKAAATAILRTAQQRQAQLSGARIPLTDQGQIADYMKRAGNDPRKATAMAEADGYVIPEDKPAAPAAPVQRRGWQFGPIGSR